ncbi:NAD(P)-dependent oxidoreductase [Nocardioides aequoreus]|uniref:NAD(P)-dependent oxidoreductase n=1 Tax=Nocardioides aequoreus TaxID=397278 RepID=UPI0004C37DFB|nr:NAD(P)-dependent oxidoreductase [Nocardioides aequoreus]
MTLGWLGTGRMGSAMARRLVDAGNEVLVWNRTASKTEPLVRAGATAVPTVGDLGAAEVVFVMVSRPEDLEQVLVGPDGLLRAERLPEVVVDCSTVSAETSARMRGLAAEVGVEFLASPISGNPHVVAEGGACLVCSGPEATFLRVQPHLLQIAKVAVHAGEAEQSRLVKLAHNLYLGMMVQALVEVTALAEKAGTSRTAFLEFLNGTVISSDWVRKRTPDLLALDWTPTFTTELLRKDFDLGLAEARALEVPMPVAAATHQLIQAAIGTGQRDDDFLSLFVQEARAAGLTPVPETRPEV